MTEKEWLASADSTQMLKFLKGKGGERKSRLFAVAYCREVWSSLTDKRSRIAIRKLETYIDNLNNCRLRQDAYNIANAAYVDLQRSESPFRAAACAVVFAANLRIPHVKDGIFEHALTNTGILDRVDVWRLECQFIRDLFGNPFRPVTLQPSWLTSTVLALAAGIYANRAFDHMPILADALMDAGCENEEILNHCRGDGLHVRGCWVVDLILGKE